MLPEGVEVWTVELDEIDELLKTEPVEELWLDERDIDNVDDWPEDVSVDVAELLVRLELRDELVHAAVSYDVVPPVRVVVVIPKDVMRSLRSKVSVGVTEVELASVGVGVTVTVVVGDEATTENANCAAVHTSVEE